MSGGRGQAWPDPNIRIGPYKILPRTDGRFTAYDERMPVAQRSAVISETLEGACEGARQLVALGAPVGTVADEPPPREDSSPGRGQIRVLGKSLSSYSRSRKATDAPEGP